MRKEIGKDFKKHEKKKKTKTGVSKKRPKDNDSIHDWWAASNQSVFAKVHNMLQGILLFTAKPAEAVTISFLAQNIFFFHYNLAGC